MKKTITTTIKMTPEDITTAIKDYLKKYCEFVADNIIFDIEMVDITQTYDTYDRYEAKFDGATCTVIRETEK